jgi:hypothetical protein
MPRAAARLVGRDGLRQDSVTGLRAAGTIRPQYQPLAISCRKQHNACGLDGAGLPGSGPTTMALVWHEGYAVANVPAHSFPVDNLDQEKLFLSRLAPGAPQKRAALVVVVILIIAFFLTAGLPSSIRPPKIVAFVAAYATVLVSRTYPQHRMVCRPNLWMACKRDHSDRVLLVRNYLALRPDPSSRNWSAPDRAGSPRGSRFGKEEPSSPLARASDLYMLRLVGFRTEKRHRAALSQEGNACALGPTAT